MLTTVRTGQPSQSIFKENSTFNLDYPSRSALSLVWMIALLVFTKNFKKRLIFHFQDDQSKQSVLAFRDHP